MLSVQHRKAHVITILFDIGKTLKSLNISTNILSKTMQIKNPEDNLRLEHNHFKKCCEKSCNLNVVRETIGKFKFVS